MITDRKYLARVKLCVGVRCECEAINGNGVAPRRTVRHQRLEPLGSAHDNLVSQWEIEMGKRAFRHFERAL
jgi:hypothetical protein